MKNVYAWVRIFGYAWLVFLAACSGTPSSGCSTNSVGGGSALCGTGGSGGSTVPTGPVRYISVGDPTACALLNNGTVKCWGQNDRGQVGNGTTSDLVSTATSVSGITDAIAIDSIGWYTCAVLSNATVKCWGQNDYRQLGSDIGGISSTPVSVPNISNATQVALGWDHACALLADKTVKCWGRCSEKQCGNATSSANAPPTTVEGVTDVKAISAYDYHTCGLQSNGTVKCWGQIALGLTNDYTSQYPTAVVDASNNPISGITMIASGHYFDIAANSSGVWAWGNGNAGTLGDGLAKGRSYAAAVSNLSNPVGITAQYGSACALLQNGTVSCWGENAAKTIADPTGPTYFSLTPDPVDGVSGGIQISVGQSSACYLKNDGKVYCWGSNYRGILGNGTTTDSATPVQVIGM